MAELIVNISLLELIQRGHINAPTEIYGVHGDIEIKAMLCKNATIIFRDIEFSSPSVAAGQAITLIGKVRTPGRQYLSINGWRFWRIKLADGSSRALNDIRAEAMRA